LGIEIIFQIGAIGILAAVVCSLLKQSGKDELATFVSLASVIIVILMVLNMVAELFNTVRTLFSLY